MKEWVYETQISVIPNVYELTKSTSLQCLSTKSQISKFLGLTKRLNIWSSEWPQAPLLCISLIHSHWVSLSLSQFSYWWLSGRPRGSRGLCPCEFTVTGYACLGSADHPQLPGHLLDWPLDADWPSSATFLWISSIYWLADLSWPSEVRENVRHPFTRLPLHDFFSLP